MGSHFSRLVLPVLVILSMSGLATASPAAAATTGTVCGRVTAFVAPTAVTNGSITINGTAEVISSSAAASLAAGTIATLTSLASANATTCLAITANGSGQIVALSIAATASLCGVVTANVAANTFTINGVSLAGSLFSAQERSLLTLAARAGVSTCALVTIGSNGQLASANVTAVVTVCGRVTLDSAGNVAVNGILIGNDLLDASTLAALRLAAQVGGNACATVRGTSTGTTTTVAASITATVCGTVTAVSGTTISINGFTFNLATGTTANVRVGDHACVNLVPAPGGSGTEVKSVTGSGTQPGTSPGTGGTAGGTLPNTATSLPGTDLSVIPVAFGLGLLLMALGLTLNQRRRSHR